MQLILANSLLLTLALPALADDWTGKSVRPKADGLKLGHKHNGGLVCDGATLDKVKSGES